MTQIAKLKNEALELLEKASTLEEIEELKIRFLSRKGELAGLFSEIPKLDPAERKQFGQGINELKILLTEGLEEKEATLKRSKRDLPPVDITRDPFPFRKGSVHPLSATYIEIINIFKYLGFIVVEGPEIEEDFYNFEGLNFPPDHPARDEQASFFMQNGKLLRTHTSPVQVRVMESQEPPLAVVSPGKCYRRDTIDASHSSMFNQLEGFLVDENISVAELKGTIKCFIKELFGEKKTRFRPHFFPFTEPSMEVDVECVFCGGKGCNVCKKTGWLEIMGAGMIDPNVFIKAGLDPVKYSGFAFGMGIERIAMLRYDINDMRLFFENDIEFLDQFR